MKLEDVIQRGIAASRPAAATVPEGTLYFSTDTQVLERSTGSAWESYSSAASTGDVTGPGSALDQAIVVFDGSTGKVIQDSGVLLTALATLPIAESDVTGLVTDLAAKAPLASPALTGVPTVPTASVGTNTTQAASTAFVIANAGGGVTLPIAESDVTNLVTDLAAKAPLASPALTGVPTVPTATAGTSTTQAASTAFVTTADATLAPKASPTFTGTATFSGQFGPPLYNAGNSGASLTIDFDNGNDQYITLTGNAAITFSHPVSGFRYALVFNTGAGGFTPTFPGTVSWLDAVPTLPTTASKHWIAVLLYLGNVTKYLASFSKEP